MSLNERKPLKDIRNGNDAKTVKDVIDVIDRFLASAGGTKRRKRDMEKVLERLFDYAGNKGEDPAALLNRLLDAEERRIKEAREKSARRLSEQIENCRKAYNGYYACEPEKNAVYHKAFHSEGGIFDCMNKYHEVVKRLLPMADTPENMQLIIWGNALQYLRFALDKLDKKSELPVKKLETAEECERYLKEERQISLKIENIEEVINIFNREQKIEGGRREQRMQYEEIQRELTAGTAAEYIREFKEGIPYSEEDMQTAVYLYQEKAHVLDNIFTKILSDMNQLQEREEQKDEFVERV